jgi:hypothetical protein
MIIDTNGKVGKITGKTFFPRRSQKYTTEIKNAGIPAISLFEC